MSLGLGELFVQIGAIGNSKEVKAFGEAVKKAGKAIDDFDKKRNKANDNGTKFNTTLKGTIGAIAGVIGGLAAAYWALDRLTTSLAKQNQQWLNLTRQSDIALSTFQKWGTIGKIVGVDNAAQQLENLNQKIFNLRLTGEGAKGFQMAGIMPTTADDVLEQLRSRISGMSNTAATYLLQQMGLDPKMITLLRMGRKEWEEYLEVSKRYTLTKDQRESIEFYNRQLEVTKIRIQYLKDKAILAILPAFTRFTKFLTSAVEGLTKFFKWVDKMCESMSDLQKGIVIVISAIEALFLALWAFSAHPIIATITAIIAAIMLLADDINQYITGGDSIIGLLENGLRDLDLKGYIDFPVPEWMKSLIYIIKAFKIGGNTIRDFFSGSMVEGTLRDMGIDPQTGKRITTSSTQDRQFTSNMSSGARYFTNNRNQTNTLNQTNYIQTSETTDELKSSLLFFRQQVMPG